MKKIQTERIGNGDIIWSLAEANTALNEDKDVLLIAPKKKIIDLSVCIESGIDVEFTNGDFISGVCGQLESIDKNVVSPYKKKGDAWLDKAWFSRCRVRQNHFHYHVDGTGSPIPEGLKVYFITKTEKQFKTVRYKLLDWNGIVAFKVLDVAPNYKYE